LSETEDKKPQDESAELEDSGTVANSDAILEFAEEATHECAEALREKEQFKRLAQRAQADLVNYRRRIEDEQESSRLRNQQRIVLKFADVIDQLDVALNAEGADSADPNWLEGISAIKKNFETTLSSEGFARFECVTDEFDPRKHEALLLTPTADHKPNTVITELRPGYVRNDEVVRPAQVEIAVEPPEEEISENGSE
tara:strand:+ start:3213 stop:3806 length:594 start_codon:yes stop_codon:yes gene_type:complete